MSAAAQATDCQSFDRRRCLRSGVSRGDNRVISTGYNGSVSGTEHCIDHEWHAVVKVAVFEPFTPRLMPSCKEAEREFKKFDLCDPFSVSEYNCYKLVASAWFISASRMDDYAQYLYQEKGTS